MVQYASSLRCSHYNKKMLFAKLRCSPSTISQRRTLYKVIVGCVRAEYFDKKPIILPLTHPTVSYTLYANSLVMCALHTYEFIYYFCALPACKPHSFIVDSSHHQRPSRSCWFGNTGLVQGSQPMLTKPRSCNLL